MVRTVIIILDTACTAALFIGAAHYVNLQPGLARSIHKSYDQTSK